MKSKEIVVSISCITYNHVPYIRECLDGFLMQECEFSFEVLIHDDASTDGTAEIIREYQEKFPDIIKPVIQKENQYSKGVRSIGTKFNIPRAKGKYIAMCEGDDYWTDPLKLQKQVDFLEANSDYTITVGGFISKNEYSDAQKTIIRKNKTQNNNNKGYTFTLEDTYKNWSTKVLTAVFINDKKLFSFLLEYKYARDVHLFYHLLKKGKGFYFTEVFGVHRIHTGGVHSMIGKRKRIIGAYLIYKELHDKNKDKYTRKMSLNYHCMVLNFKIYDNKFIKSYNIKTSFLLKNIIKLMNSPADISLLYQIFVGIKSKQKLKALIKRT